MPPSETDAARAEIAASPTYARGEVVRYRDRHGRVQCGAVQTIEARRCFGVEPLIIYQLEHPSYQARRFYTTDENIYEAVS